MMNPKANLSFEILRRKKNMVQVNKKEELDKKNVEDILALTPLQEGMLFHYLKDPQRDLYFEQLCLELSGEINVEYFEKAWNVVVDTNEMLRTLFHWEKMKHPTQVVLKKHHITPLYHDFSNIHRSEKEKLSQEVKINDRKKKFDLQEVPWRITLCKMGKNQYEMIISNHHILYDGWSNGIILQEFFNAYNDLSKGKELIKPVKTKFKEFVQWTQKQGTEIDRQEKFWRNCLNGFDTPTRLSIKKQKKEKQVILLERCPVQLGSSIMIELNRFIRKHKLTLASFLYSAWGLLLQKYNNSDDVIFGTTVSGRPAKIKGIEDIVGLFINTLPLRLKTIPGETILDCLFGTNNMLQQREEFENSSLVEIREYSEINTGEELFDSIMVIENYPLDIRLSEGNKKGMASPTYYCCKNMQTPEEKSWNENKVLPYSNTELSVNSYSMFEMTHYDLTVAISTVENVEIDFSYNQELLDKDTIERLSRHFVLLMGTIIKNPVKKIREIEIISNEEKRQILFDFNDTGSDYLHDKTLHQLFAEQVENAPDHIALLGPDGARGLAPLLTPISISYRELNRKSNQLAGMLIEKGVKPDTIAAIMVERSIEMIITILGIIKAGGAYLPIDPEYPQERINYISADSNAQILVTTQDLTKGIEFEREIIYLPFHPSTLTASHLPFSTLTSTLTCQVSPANLAYSMYTSGSTGKPKGVLVDHGNVVRLVINVNYVELTGETRILQTGAPVFDATTFEIWGTLLNGGQLILVSNDIILNADLLGNALAKYRITTLWLTSPLFNQLARQNSRIFSVLKYLLVGGDVLSPQIINKVRNENKGLKIINGYGPTENTTFSTTYLVDKDFRQNIPIGKPISNSTAYILDKYGYLQPIGLVGELYVGGDGVARGYLNNPQLTAEKFDHESSPHHSPHYPIYRTGDLVRWLWDGNIEFFGRIDHQVKVRGFRIELGEIENQLLKHEKVKEAVVIDIENKNGEKNLAAYLVSDSEASILVPQLKEYLLECLPDYMVPVYWMQINKMPLTPTGKIDRRGLPVPEFTSFEKYVPPTDEIEKKLVEIWAAVLGIESSLIGIHNNFFKLGGHSLKASQLINRIHKEFGVRLELAACLKTPTIRQIGEYLQSSARDGDNGATPIIPVEEKEYYPLSSAQERLYALQQMDRENVAYNIFFSRVFEEKINREKLEQAFQHLIHRHECLRTSFVMIDGQIVQRIHPEVTFAFERCPLPINHFSRPFDLSQAPLLRVGLVTHENKELTLLIDLHHIITDGVSQAVLIKELLELCQGETLPSSRLRYKDFSRWQQQWKKEEFKPQEAFWLREFQDKIPRLNMPIDFPRPEVQCFEGDILIFELNKNETDELKKMAREESVTSFMMLLAVYYVFLAAVSHQEDIVVGVPTVGRRDADLENIIGMFVNTLALRNFPRREITFRTLLKNVKTRTLKAFENQDYQFDDLVERLLSTRDARRNPIFDVMFTFNYWKDEAYDLNLEHILNKTARFDLILHTFEKNETLFFAFEYSTRLYKKETIKRFVVYFNKILSSVMENPDKNISGIEIISDEEKNRLIRSIKNNDEKSAILMEHAVRNKAKEQKQGTLLTADFDL